MVESTTKLRALFLATLVVFSSMAVILMTPTALAAVTVDAGNSSVTDGGTITGFEANASNNTRVTFHNDGNNINSSYLEIREPSDFKEIYYTNNTPHALVQGTFDKAEFNMSHDEFKYLPMEANEDKKFTFRFVNSSSESVTKNISVTFNNTGDRTVVYAGDHFRDTDDFTEKQGGFAGFFAKDISEIDDDDVTVDGDKTTVYYKLANGTIHDPFDDATTDASSEDWLIAQQLYVDGVPTKVFYDEAPDSVDDEDTYGVYNSDDEVVEINLGDEHSDADDVDVKLVGNNRYGPQTIAGQVAPFIGNENTVFSFSDIGETFGTNALGFLMPGGFLGAFGLLIGRNRIGA